jgi:DNA mismatch repair protein MutL
VLYAPADTQHFSLQAPVPPPFTERIQFDGSIAVEANAAVFRCVATLPQHFFPTDGCASGNRRTRSRRKRPRTAARASLKPLGQIRESFILAVNHEGLWIIDQHVAHERVLFEKVLKQRAAQKVESQRLLMPLLIELTPGAASRIRRNFR